MANASSEFSKRFSLGVSQVENCFPMSVKGLEPIWKTIKNRTMQTMSVQGLKLLRKSVKNGTMQRRLARQSLHNAYPRKQK